jgi:ParB/RepB/Spo0J family partition protein
MKNGELPNPSPVIRRMRVDEIVVKGDFRELDKKIVSSLAESIEEVGLMNPPTVFIKSPKDESGTEEVHLIAGNIRLAATKKLGWEYIDVIVVKRIKKKNRMRQITENLHRKDLSKLERGKLIKEWVELYAKDGGQDAHHQPHDKGISKAAEKFGRSRRTIRRAMKAGSLGAEVEKVLKKAGLQDNEQVLLEVEKEKPENRAAKLEEIVRRRKAKRPKKTKIATSKPDVSDDDDWSDTPFEKLKAAWEDSPALRKEWANASADDRQRFIDEVLLADDNADEWDTAA